MIRVYQLSNFSAAHWIFCNRQSTGFRHATRRITVPMYVGGTIRPSAPRIGPQQIPLLRWADRFSSICGKRQSTCRRDPTTNACPCGSTCSASASSLCHEPTKLPRSFRASTRLRMRDSVSAWTSSGMFSSGGNLSAHSWGLNDIKRSS